VSMTLWLLECKDMNLGRLFTFYAENEQEAEQHVSEYLALHPNLVYVSLNEQPQGFVLFHFRRPGRVECKE
jgi:hypothetical protein